MGILTIIKNLFKTEEEQEPETITLNQLETWIQNKEEKNKSDIIEVMEFFEEQIALLIKKLKEHEQILKNIDLTEKKTEERAKFIIKQNLDHYTNHLNKLIKDLEKIEIQEPNILIKNLDNLFIEFNKKSSMNFQKATFLIGKELQETKDSIDNFFKTIKQYLDKNKSLLKTQETTRNTKNKLKQIQNINQTNQEIKQELENQNNKITTLNNQIQNNNQTIDEIKESKEYEKEIKTKQEITKKKQALSKESQNLKELINFKTLTNIFHSNKKEMDLIKQFQDNFQETLDKDNQETLISLLTSANLDTIKAKQKIKQITELKEQISKSEDDFNQKGNANILIQETEIKKAKQEIHEIEYNTTRKKQRLEKNNQENSDIINKIKSKLKCINIILIEEEITKKEDKEDNQDKESKEDNQEEKQDKLEDDPIIIED
jgi:hypothetical protein